MNEKTLSVKESKSAKIYALYYGGCTCLGIIHSIFTLTFITETWFGAEEILFAAFVPIYAIGAYLLCKKLRLNSSKSTINIIKTGMLVLSGILVGIVISLLIDFAVCIFGMYSFSIQDYPH